MDRGAYRSAPSMLGLFPFAPVALALLPGLLANEVILPEEDARSTVAPPSSAPLPDAVMETALAEAL